MILRMEELQDCCSKILAAVDTNALAPVTETLEIKAEDQCVYISVTNREYYARVKLFSGEVENFIASVNANIFLKLIAQTTTETVELTLDGNSLVVRGNGTYKLPLIYDGDALMEVPEITINNVTSSFSIQSATLHSLITYNSKELLKGMASKPVQKLYYIDESGAITFTNGACVNEFELEKPVKILLGNKLVKLFKLFKSETVDFRLGYDAISEEMVQTKVTFENDDISISAILNCDDRLLHDVPTEKIREMALSEYPHRCVLNKDELLRTIGRILLFSESKTKVLNAFDFSADELKVWDADHINCEVIPLETHVEGLSDTYTCVFDIVDLKTTLDCLNDNYLNIKFGTGRSAVIEMRNVHYVLPDCNVR